VKPNRELVKISKGKTIQLSEDRKMEVEYANRKLFQKIYAIELKPIPEYLSPNLHEHERASPVLVARIARKQKLLETIQ
jgi:hypothetical protein